MTLVRLCGRDRLDRARCAQANAMNRVQQTALNFHIALTPSPRCASWCAPLSSAASWEDKCIGNNWRPDGWCTNCTECKQLVASSSGKKSNRSSHSNESLLDSIWEQATNGIESRGRGSMGLRQRFASFAGGLNCSHYQNPRSSERATEALRYMYLMPLLMSERPECSAMGTSMCVLQTPKTGSSFLKAAFSLPVNVPKRYLGTYSRLAERCTRVIVLVRDPIERLISSIGTVSNRIGCRNMASFRNETWCRRMISVSDFEAYTSSALKSYRHLQGMCYTHLDRHSVAPSPGKDSVLMSELHLAPQTFFARLLPVGAQIYPLTVAQLSSLASTFGDNGTCVPRIRRASANVKEGATRSPILRTLNASLLRQLRPSFVAWLETELADDLYLTQS